MGHLTGRGSSAGSRDRDLRGGVTSPLPRGTPPAVLRSLVSSIAVASLVACVEDVSQLRGRCPAALPVSSSSTAVVMAPHERACVRFQTSIEVLPSPRGGFALAVEERACNVCEEEVAFRAVERVGASSDGPEVWSAAARGRAWLGVEDSAGRRFLGECFGVESAEQQKDVEREYVFAPGEALLQTFTVGASALEDGRPLDLPYYSNPVDYADPALRLFVVHVGPVEGVFPSGGQVCSSLGVGFSMPRDLPESALQYVDDLLLTGEWSRYDWR